MKYFLYFLGFVAIVLLVWSVGYSIYQGYFLEKPVYEVVEEKNGYEIRQYESYIVAKVEVERDGQDGLNEGFVILADYIFGNNTSANENLSEEIKMTSPVLSSTENSEEIKMTSPVSSEVVDGKKYVSFVMPSKYTLETLPVPNDDRVELERVDTPLFAVKTVRGRSTDQKMKEAKQELITELQESDYMIGETSFAYYDPPLTPWFLKRSEVLVRVSN